jgi:acetyl-CoA carboxylase alpha subunit
MNDQIDAIQEIEEAITDLQAMSRPQDAIIQSEIRRLDDRLRQIELLQPIFLQPV